MAGWKEKLGKRVRARRQILFSRDDDEIAELASLIGRMPRKAVVLWALEMAGEAVGALEARHPAEARPRVALEMSWKWAAGEVKMPAARRAILDCHGVAKEMGSAADVARCHAVGQACGTVHANGHAIGFPVYELTALVREAGLENCDGIIRERMEHYADRLAYWRDNHANVPARWAAFLEKG